MIGIISEWERSKSVDRCHSTLHCYTRGFFMLQQNATTRSRQDKNFPLGYSFFSNQFFGSLSMDFGQQIWECGRRRGKYINRGCVIGWYQVSTIPTNAYTVDCLIMGSRLKDSDTVLWNESESVWMCVFWSKPIVLNDWTCSKKTSTKWGPWDQICCFFLQPQRARQNKNVSVRERKNTAAPRSALQGVRTRCREISITTKFSYS